MKPCKLIAIPNNNRNIPVNAMDDDFSQGIAIDRISIRKSDFKTAKQYEEATQAHRDEGHTFHIVEKGVVIIEIDFQEYTITAPSVVYMHPNQVHRILAFKNVTVCSLAIKNEYLHADHLTLLEEIAPIKPLVLTRKTHKDISGMFSLCLDLSKQKGKRLYRLILKDSGNTLVALIISALLSQYKFPGILSRSEEITASFKQSVEKNYRQDKRPAAYARRLNISTHYLNESVKNVTGLSVSLHIQERIILEAKRLLYHTNKSVKEIAFDLGYEDHAYFSRLFTKATGVSALTFRSKRHD